MIYGIGVDLVDIKRMQKVLERWGDRFVARVFTEAEAALCRQRGNPSSSFATRFAAKEAFAKAIGLGMRQGVRWRDIEVFHHPGGKPDLRLHGKSSDLCREKAIQGFHLSLSDEGGFAIAMVVLETALDSKLP